MRLSPSLTKLMTRTAILAAALAIFPACDDDDDEPAPATLYGRLGEEAGIRTVTTDFITRVVGDAKINGYFLNAQVDGGRLIDCLVKQIGNATGGPQIYPDPAGTENGCRDMAASHQGLKISMQDFNDLVGHLVAALQAAGVAQADIDTITGVLGPLAPDIVEDAASTGTVYQRVGRKPAIQVVVADFVGRVAGDAAINGFFGSTNIDRLTTCLVRQVCSIDGPCVYGSEVDGEPGVAANDPCLDMMTSHAGLVDAAQSPITIDDFNALVGHLVAALDAAGVLTADKNAILGALGPLCPTIVADAESCAP